MDAKLGGEVGHRSGGVRIMLAGPQVAIAHIPIKSQNHRIILAQEQRVTGDLLDPFGGYLPQHLHRVVPGGAPEGIIKHFPQVARFLMPAPPQIVSQVRQPLNAGWEFFQNGGQSVFHILPTSSEIDPLPVMDSERAAKPTRPL